MSVPIKVALVDDHTITREGIKELLNQDFSNRFHVVGDFSNGKEFLNFLKDDSCDVVLMDIHMPVKTGDSTIEVLAKFHPEVSVVVLSMITMDYMIDKVMAAGAKAKGTWWWWATFVLLEPHVSVYERIPKKLNRILKYIARWRFMAKT